MKYPSFRRTLLGAAVLLLLSGFELRADSIPNDQLMQELMVEDLASTVFMIEYQYGPPTVPTTLRFGTLIDATAPGYLYALVPGSTYLGGAITLSDAATYNSISDTLTFNSSGAFGGSTLHTTGTEAVNTGIPGQVDFNFNEPFFQNGAQVKRAQNTNPCILLVYPDRIDNSCPGQLYDLHNKPLANSSYLVQGTLRGGVLVTSFFTDLAPGDPAYDFTGTAILGDGYEELLSGSSPEGGGAGTFSITILATP